MTTPCTINFLGMNLLYASSDSSVETVGRTAKVDGRGIVEEKGSIIIDPADYWSYISDNSIDDDASYVVLKDCNVKPLSALSVSEVGRLMESLHFEEYKEAFLKNRIDGRCLMKCDSTEKVANMGMSIIVKANIFLDMITKIKSTRGAMPSRIWTTYR